MFDSYQKTELEIWLENLYLKHDIISPSDLAIDNVAKKLNMNIAYMEGAREVALWDEEDAIIFLNPNKPTETMRKIFFHELCHPLRHHGDQERFVDSFITLQERQANQFVLYAAMPFYMIKQLDLPQSEHHLSSLLAFTFHVPLRLAQKRVDQIKRRIQQANLDHEFIKQHSNYKKSYDPSNWSHETKAIMDQLYKQLKGAQ
ncbi:ImmA/IrrE family metallo-endopeptidase [Gracilibacillus sp. YIM 98692]|uniref:ImmA/IrrE family metallo-endopeptidase n=1 Tax=Gracilibacillus sp. YIM 98692 TaxID=2663532 RepID=UPI0013D66F67|nr:ImmA/IrrE family metallo-endopeptidase [Gracilibacillus sp. YIM 98692]